jgi:uncharacterized protein YndB with AHSA1/START domain/DNA-binding transcriptional ArsR family regulator
VNNYAELDRSFLALSHPVRRAIVERLVGGPATVGAASGGLGVSKPAVTKHLKMLEDAGVVTRTVDGRTHVLRLEPEGLRGASEWLGLHRSLWEAKFKAVENTCRLQRRTGGPGMTEIRQEIALELEHRYAAPRERVFEAWTNPEVLKRWWAAAPTWETPLAEVDARVGGGYRLSMRTDAGEVHTVRGEFTEVEPPGRLAYTWSWEEGPDAAMAGSEETLVVVDFVEDGDGTLVKLTHSGFSAEQIRDMHVQGWQAVLANLERVVFS